MGITKSFLILLICSILMPFRSTAQASEPDWHLYSIEDFNFYYQHHELEQIVQLKKPFKQELFILQNQLNYHLNNKVNLFLINNDQMADQLLNSPFPHVGHEAGLVSGEHFKVVINTMGSPQEILKSFRTQCGRLIFNEMMYGVSFQDQIRNANLLYLPDWLVEGLEFYLGDQWSTQTDNKWRMVYEQIGFDHFHQIPAKYDALKGAAFIKFITDNYGINSLPTVLYMARLTRKFHTALYYSFQRSPSDVFSEWRAYYIMAYLQDQRKRIPVGGTPYPEDEIRDLYVKGLTEHYALVQRMNQIHLLHQKDGIRETIFRFPKSERSLPSFSGSIQRNTEGLLIFSQKDQQLQLREMSSGSTAEFPIRATVIKTADNSMFVLDATFDSSRIYSIRKEEGQWQYQQEAAFGGYVSDFLHYKHNSWLVFKTDWYGIGQLIEYQGIDSVLHFETVYDIKQLIENSDHSLFFNMNKNGVYNGVRFVLESSEMQYLTDYRSDIGFHQSSDSFFAEYIKVLDQSSLFITEAVDLDDLFVYDSLAPTYFSVHRSLDFEEVVDEEYIPEQDSLPNYRFVSPFPAHKDFTTSNYDSLKRLDDELRKKEARLGDAPDRLMPSTFYVQLFNELMDNQDIAQEEAIPAYVSNQLGVRLGGSVANQFNTKNFAFDLLAFRFWQQRDVAFRYNLQKNKVPLQFSAFHRQRLVFEQGFGIRKDRSNLLGFKYGYTAGTGVGFQHQIKLRYDESIELGDIGTASEKASSFSIMSPVYFYWKRSSQQEHWSKRWQWKLKAGAEPYLKDGEFSTNVISSLKVRKGVGKISRLNVTANAGISMGPRPTFFVLGGTSTDVLANYFDRSFSTFKDPAFHRFVYGVRGFQPNYRNGNSYMTASAEWEFSLFDAIMRRPLFSEILDQLSVAVFTDIGTSMYGKSIYDNANALNTEIFDSPGSSFTIQVRNVRNPMVGSFGAGVRTSLYSYYLRLDYAYGLENGNFRDPMFHLSVGRPIF